MQKAVLSTAPGSCARHHESSYLALTQVNGDGLQRSGFVKGDRPATSQPEVARCDSCRIEEEERIAKHRHFKAQGQARLEELIRDARAGKKAKQGAKERKLGSDPFDFVPQGLTHKDFVFGDGPTRG